MAKKPKKQLVHIFQPEKGKHNFGDLLGFKIAERLLAPKKITPVLYNDLTPEERAEFQSVLIPIGTAFASSTARSLPATIEKHFWGCGFGCDSSFRLADHPTVKVHGVRGPMSAAALGLDGEVFGDPGFLAPRFWPSEDGTDSRVSYASHINLKEIPEAFLDRIQADTVWQPGCTLEEFEAKLAEILAPGMMVCASLHAWIIRMAYKLPCAFGWPPGALPEYPMKYHDACALLRVPFLPVQTLRDAWEWWESFGKSAAIDEAALDKLVAIFPFPACP